MIHESERGQTRGDCPAQVLRRADHWAGTARSVYAATMLLAGISFVPMRRAVAVQFRGDAAYEAVARRAARKNYVSLSLYVISVPLAFIHPAITLALTFVVAGIYFLPNAWLGEKD
jgi:hypothetical protein